ncbi:HlyC/CorC family transporter [Tenacibaculum finnmarkense genomovar finnmarkense]|uniref:hemolysin family protein n=1 Tax=Tenacibaculum finnmarkense TaxID=2781243 RepID=UPI001E5A43A6|nr:hemolysin family protein [Tenacibaculum finnmarkense]MCD8416357.1 hemolysin family protein [Tenacibaculum finnmarkense genomovar finnmarkense]MCG8185017.1 HlyC/CorC family transporter [Tenacibaculum finnmarkense genomovar finnmarkense]MCG8201149.1 HlyC/CorC family transporter [Tenacibaculum finnmarkense genomovar finnmarkense]MCG8208976.1 HlyC/CorC family transporter [Tenacibaculum finnmarkense genomovar finnmarkense]MCG8211709.1 HlyC/CorC family transporter [Tenacibaculum finnmarkense geno
MEFEIIVIFASILFSAFFSGMEIAFISANKLHIELEKNRVGFLPKILAILTEKSSKFITTMLVGNNVALVIYSYFMGRLLMHWFQLALPSTITFVNYLLDDLSLLTQTVISTIVILVTAEFLPKTMFRIYANEMLNFFVVPAYFFYLLFYGITWVITKISDFFLFLIFQIKENETKTEFSKEELGNYIVEQLDRGNDADAIDSEIQIFQNALEFHKVKAREIMVPRTEIMAIEMHESVENLKNIFITTGLSKILVYKNSLDDILGYVNAFELFKNPTSIKSILLPVEFVPESMIINDVLNSLMKKRKSIAVVVDEYGGTSGIITVEDVVEELFGEIEDEHDNQELLEEKINATEFNFSARLEVDYLNEEYDLNIPKEEAYETLGGFIINYTETIPEQGTILQLDKLYIKILKVSATKIDDLYLKITDKEA